MKKKTPVVGSGLMIVLVAVLVSVLALLARQDMGARSFFGRQRSPALAARRALNQLVSDLKRCNGSGSILRHGPAEFSFVNVDDETVAFSQEGSRLLRSGRVLLDNLREPDGLAFAYLDKNGGAATSKHKIRIVRCRLKLANGKETLVMESAGRIRVGRLEQK